MLYERLPEDNSHDVGSDIAFWTNSKRFIATMSSAYDAMWQGQFAIHARTPGAESQRCSQNIQVKRNVGFRRKMIACPIARVEIFQET